MLSQLASLKLMFEVMEVTLLRKHTYMQMLLSSKKLLTEGAILPWFNFNKFVAYTSPIEQLTTFEKEMLFRNFYSYERVKLYVDTWYKRHEHLIKAFRTQSGWNESEFYLNLNETVDTPISMLNAYRDFMLLAFSYRYDKPKFREGLPAEHKAPNHQISLMFLDVFEKTINEGLVSYTSSRLSESKFKKLSPLFISTPVQLSIKDKINDTINTGKTCDIATKVQSEDSFKALFGMEFHNFLPFVFNKALTVIKDFLANHFSKADYISDPSDMHSDIYSDLLRPISDNYINLIVNNKDMFVGYLLKYLSAGNRNITKQSILNKLSTYVHQFNVVFNMRSFLGVYFDRYRSNVFSNSFYLEHLGETYDTPNVSYPSNFVLPFAIPEDRRLKDYAMRFARILYLLQNTTFENFFKWSMSSALYTSITTSKIRTNTHRYHTSNVKTWSQFSTDLNEYLNFRSDTKNFLINLHPAALINASLGYGGWSSCHSHINLPTSEMLKLGTSRGSFPIAGHSYWFGNYQMVQGNAFVIVEPPVISKERQWLIPNKVRTIAWVAEDFSSIRMNLPYPTKQNGGVPDEMYLEYTAIRERMASIFKPFISIPEPHTWIRVSSNGNNSVNAVDIKHGGDSFTSDINILNSNGEPDDVYRGYTGEYLQSASVLKELLVSKGSNSSTLIHSSDFLPLNNERLVRGCQPETLAERNDYADFSYEQPGGFTNHTFISKYTRCFSNSLDAVLDLHTALPFNQKFLLQLDSNDFISYATFLANSDKYFYCQDTKLFSTEVIKVYVDKSKNFSYFSKNFEGAKRCSVSNEFFLPSLMVDDVSIFELLKRSQVEWSFIIDQFLQRKLVFVYDDSVSLNNFLDNLSTKTNYRWASGKLPNEYHFDTTKAIIFSDGVLKLKSVDDLEGFNIVDVKNLIFKS